MVAAVRRVRLRAGQYQGSIRLGGKRPVSRRGESRPCARRGLHLLGNDHRRFEINDTELGIGRFGIYVLAATRSLDVLFLEIAVMTDLTATSNFALHYSTPGYDLDGTKRALVRTVNDIDAQDYDDATST